MSKSLLAADRCQSAVPVLPTEVVRGWRFTATGRAWPGLLVGSTPCFRVARPLQVEVLLEVERGAPVPVERQAAGVAGEDPVCKAQFGFHCAAARTRLTRREPPVGDGELPAVPPGLVVELASDLAEGGVGDVPGQLVVLEHARDGEVFHDDGAVGGGQVGGELVDRVFARIRDPSVDTGHFSPGGFGAGRGSLAGG